MELSMTSPSQPQPYAYVFQDEDPDTPWIALKESHSLSQLHTKYWGDPIQGNESGVQTLSEGQPMEDDEDQPLDDDEDQSEVGPDSGCFVLDFGIEASANLKALGTAGLHPSVRLLQHTLQQCMELL
jgi:hypothetical protein